MVSGANVMDFRIENVKSTTLGGTRADPPLDGGPSEDGGTVFGTEPP